jgi:hypothetical protein
MISAIEWVPAGVADPSPKKYEFSPAEVELIQMMEEHNMNDLQGVQAHLQRQQMSHDMVSPKKRQQQICDIHKELPADLRMDEYSSDDDDNNNNNLAVQGTMIGKLLVENDDDDNDEICDDDESAEKSDAKNFDHDDDDDQSEDDDDLENVPDTREYTPVDLEGLKAIGLSQIGTNAPAYMDGDNDDDDENDSDGEDVRIQPNDAVVVVAKTEDVRIPRLKLTLFVEWHLTPNGLCHI